MYRCPYLVFMQHHYYLCNRIPFPCLNEVLLLIDGGKWIYWINLAPTAPVFEVQQGETLCWMGQRLKKGVLKCKAKIPVGCHFTADIDWKSSVQIYLFISLNVAWWQTSIIHFGFNFYCAASLKKGDNFSCHHTNSDMHIVQKRMFFKLMPNFYINVIF